MGGSNEFIECSCRGLVTEGVSGAVGQFGGDGLEVGLLVGDGCSFGEVTVVMPVGVFAGSSLPGAVGLGENIYTLVLWVRCWSRAISGSWSKASCAPLCREGLVYGG